MRSVPMVSDTAGQETSPEYGTVRRHISEVPVAGAAGASMAAGQFSAPVLVRVALPSGPALQAIPDPRSALTVLSRGWLGGFPLDWPDYATCLEKLGRAVIDPRPERV